MRLRLWCVFIIAEPLRSVRANRKNVGEISLINVETTTTDPEYHYRALASIQTEASAGVWEN
jgi:hypothetical protein